MIDSPSPLGFFELYAGGGISFAGDEVSAIELAENFIYRHYGLPRAKGQASTPALVLGMLRAQGLSGLFAALARPRTRKQAIEHHYHAPAHFWEAVLDPYLQYTCAFFVSGEDSLETAQINKMEKVAGKLRLRQGASLLDIGCGWGGFARFACERFDAAVTGVTLSHMQADYATGTMLRAVPGAKVAIRETDFLRWTDTQTYDAVSAIGVFEHIGRSNAAAFFAGVARRLKRHGLFLNQAIAVEPSAADVPGRDFVKERIFPGGELLPINETILAASKAGLELLHVENMREHYASTLREWRRRVTVLERLPPADLTAKFIRGFYFYLLLAEYGFRSSRLTIYQSLFRLRGRLGGDGALAPLPHGAGAVAQVGRNA